jgi:hypothetical protein
VADPTRDQALADAVLVMHVLYLGFVVVGLLLVALGGLRGWGWVRNPWFRLAHLAAIALVAVLAWADLPCPLTILESHLRSRAGAGSYQDGFIAHWLGELLYWDAPAWVFAVSYTGCGLLVVVAWAWVRPRALRRRRPRDPGGRPRRRRNA